MNCRPGDLAFIVGAEAYLGINDKIVRLSRKPAEYIGSHAFWILERPFRITVAVNVKDARGSTLAAGQDSLVNRVADANLRPIRGGELTDDEVRELYAPSRDEVSHG